MTTGIRDDWLGLERQPVSLPFQMFTIDIMQRNFCVALLDYIMPELQVITSQLRIFLAFSIDLFEDVN